MRINYEQQLGIHLVCIRVTSALTPDSTGR